MGKPGASNAQTRVRFPPPASSDSLAKLLSNIKTAERERARRLRREEGASVKELARLLGVSKSSVSLWVRDIELTEAQYLALRRRMGGRIDGSRANAVRALARRRMEQDSGRMRARRGRLLHAAGCMLYWAEGSRSRNVIEFTNSDPAMVSFFLRFLRECYSVPNPKITVTCNLFADHLERQREIEQFWLDMLRLPHECLRKSSVNVYFKYSKKKRRNRLPYGTCRLKVCDTRIVQSIYGAIQEYAGFEREEWVM
jgi:transcriptional regulator with XRE-family HTH domain